MCEEYMKDIIGRSLLLHRSVGHTEIITLLVDRTQSVMTMSSEEALVAGPSPQSTEELNDGNDVSMSSPVCNKRKLSCCAILNTSLSITIQSYRDI